MDSFNWKKVSFAWGFGIGFYSSLGRERTRTRCVRLCIWTVGLAGYSSSSGVILTTHFTECWLVTIHVAHSYHCSIFWTFLKWDPPGLCPAWSPRSGLSAGQSPVSLNAVVRIMEDFSALNWQVQWPISRVSINITSKVNRRSSQIMKNCHSPEDGLKNN